MIKSNERKRKRKRLAELAAAEEDGEEQEYMSE
jgi:hypothetical protein